MTPDPRVHAVFFKRLRFGSGVDVIEWKGLWLLTVGADFKVDRRGGGAWSMTRHRRKQPRRR
ncbi:hypothetical protein Hdeb2414_s0002g00064841 [Helianthus debilis subsp. tardiflorus]